MGESSLNSRGPSTPTQPAAFIPAWLDDVKLSPAEFRVYCRIRRREDGPDKQCIERISNMAAACKLNKDTVWKALKSLKEKELITSTTRQGQTTIFKTSTRPLFSDKSKEPSGNGGGQPSGNGGGQPSGNGGGQPSGNGGGQPSGNGGAQRIPFKESLSKALNFELKERESSKFVSAVSSARLRELRRLSKETIGTAWTHDGGKWTNRIKQGQSHAELVERVMAEVRRMATESEINTNPAAIAEDLWKRWLPGWN